MNSSSEVRERPQGDLSRARGPASPVDRFAWRDAVWESSLPASDKLVALAYAEHAGGDPERVWVTSDRLQAVTSLSRSGVVKCLRRLEASGWLEVTEPARQHFSPRYGLRLPADSPAALADTPQGYTEYTPGPHQRYTRYTPDTSRGVPGDARGVPGDARGVPGRPEPQPQPLPHPTNHQADVDDPLPARPIDGLVVEIRSHKLAATIPTPTIEDHATHLLEAGWTPDALAAALAAQDFTAARGPGLLRHRLTALSQEKPSASPRRSDTSRCADHGTLGASNCSACWSEVKAGERRADDVGRLPRTLHHAAQGASA